MEKTETVVDYLMALLDAKRSAQFASFDYTNKDGERSRYVVQLNVSTKETYEKDLETLVSIMPTLTDPLQIAAAHEVEASLHASIALKVGNNPAYTNAKTYTHVMTGVIMHKETGELYINGMQISRTVLVPGKPKKPVNSAPETIAKRTIENQLRKSKFRQFKLSSLNKAKLQGETLEFI